MIKKGNISSGFISFLFHFLLFTTPFIFTWVNEELFEFPKMLFVYVMTTLIASTWIIRMILEKRIIFKRSQFDFLIFFFLLSQLISTFASIHPYTSIFGYYSRFHAGLLSTISYLILYFSFVSNINKKQLKYYFLTLLTSSSLVSLYAIPEHFGHSFSCLLMFNEFNASCWKQDVVNRVFATFGQPNWLAAYCVTLIPLLSSLSLIKLKNQKLRIRNWILFLPLITSVLLFATLLFTKSRSGFLAFTISMGIYFLGLIYLNLKRNFAPARNAYSIAIAGGFLIAALAVGTPYTPSLSQILNSKPETQNSPISNIEYPISDPGGTDSGDIRKIIWRGGLDVWKRYPIFGSGVETFAYSYYLDRPVEHNLVSEWDFLYNKAHNEFLNFLATTGIIGLIAYLLLILGFLIFSIKYLSRAKPALSSPNVSRNLNSYLLTLGLISGYIALAISNFFGFSTVTVSLLFFLYPAFFVILTTEKLDKSASKNISVSKQPNLHLPVFLQIFLVILTLAISSYLLLSIFTKWLADYNYTQAENYISENYLSEGIKLLNSAIALSPNEALFYNQLSVASSKMAISLAQEPNPNQELVTQFVEQALLASNISISLNPVHNNFYKTRSRLFITLSQLEPEFLSEAKLTLTQAISLAPTDAKLWYYLASVQLALDETDEGIKTLEKTIEMKANYAEARMNLAQQYEIKKEFTKAKEQYQYILENISPDDPLVQEKLEKL